jgi:hypothetical protein
MDNAEIICRGAFAQLSDNHNTVLTSINLPSAISIGEQAFVNCTAIQTVSMNNVKTINSRAFPGCTTLQYVNIDSVETIGSSAFEGCNALESISLGHAKTIGDSAFSGCTLLKDADLRSVISFGNRVFSQTGGQSLIITLGNIVPTVGINMFISGGTKTVTLKIPSNTAKDYGQPASYWNTGNSWYNAFRGKGWDGTNYLNGDVNTNIILLFETY